MLEVKFAINKFFTYISLKRDYLVLKKSKVVLSLLNVLWDIGFIRNFISLKKNLLRVFINYGISGIPVFNNVKFFSYNRNSLIIKNKSYLSIKRAIVGLELFILVFFNKKIYSLKNFLNIKSSNVRGFLFCKFY